MARFIKRITAISIIVFSILAGIKTSGAHVEPLESGDAINYAYATWVGSGYYRIGEQQAFILRGNFSWTLRKWDEYDWGLELLLPATIGWYNLSKLDDVGAITFVPGLRLVYPVKENWWLKPYVQIGFGRDLSGGDTALIAGGGIKSLAVFTLKNDIELELGNNLAYADNSESDKSPVDNGFSMFEIGLNSRWPLNVTLLDRRTFLNVYFIYTDFLNELVFFDADLFEDDLTRLYKFGISLEGRPEFSILGFEFRGVGLEVSFGKDYFGIGFNTGFPF
jgi:hypothetical protein